LLLSDLTEVNQVPIIALLDKCGNRTPFADAAGPGPDTKSSEPGPKLFEARQESKVIDQK
jgi:hypothetical protein